MCASFDVPNIYVFGCNNYLMILNAFRIDESNLCLKFGDENHPKSLLAGLLAGSHSNDLRPKLRASIKPVASRSNQINDNYSIISSQSKKFKVVITTNVFLVSYFHMGVCMLKRQHTEIP